MINPPALSSLPSELYRIRHGRTRRFRRNNQEQPGRQPGRKTGNTGTQENSRGKVNYERYERREKGEEGLECFSRKTGNTGTQDRTAQTAKLRIERIVRTSNFLPPIRCPLAIGCSCARWTRRIGRGRAQRAQLQRRPDRALDSCPLTRDRGSCGLRAAGYRVEYGT